MEYRRRNRRRARGYGRYRSASYSRQRESGGSAFNVLLLTLMAAALVYVLAATPVGAYLSQKLIGRAPLPQSTQEPSSGGAEPPSSANAALDPADTAGPTAAETPAVNKREFSIPPLELFALQLGMFDSASNAQGLISSLRSLGAAGYSLATDSGVRILASCYSTEAAANSVCSRLIEQGYDAVVCPIRCDGAIITVSGTEAQLEAIGSSIELVSGLIAKLNDECIRFDAEERSCEYGLAIAGEMLEQVRTARSALEGIADPSGAIDQLEEHFIELTGCFTRFTSAPSENRVELSGRLKHLQLEVIDRCRALLGKLQAHAAA